jgi:hypothetical protein
MIGEIAMFQWPAVAQAHFNNFIVQNIQSSYPLKLIQSHLSMKADIHGGGGGNHRDHRPQSNELCSPFS